MYGLDDRFLASVSASVGRRFYDYDHYGFEAGFISSFNYKEGVRCLVPLPSVYLNIGIRLGDIK